MGAVASSPRQDAQNWAIIAPNFFISSFFCSDPAREAYSGHSGVRSAPQEEFPLQDKFLVTRMMLKQDF